LPAATSGVNGLLGRVMTIISQTSMPAQAQAAPKAKTRNLAIDRSRTFLTLVVLLHHSVIPYTYFGHTDTKSWIGYDFIVLATDSFFMAMFFFLSGLFTWPGLTRKSASAFIRDRLLRLGLPFVIAAFTIIPLAYYALALQRSTDLSFSEFWWKTVTVGPWPSGPIWFLWVLLAFDMTACVLYRLSPTLVEPINRLSLRSVDRPALFFIFLAIVTAVVYVPIRTFDGPNQWFELGPFSVQVSRVLLYAAYFFIGAGVGAAHLDRGLLSPTGGLPKTRWTWVIVALIPYCLLWGLIYIKRVILENPPVQPHWYEASYGVLFVVFSAAVAFAILAFFLSSKSPGPTLLDQMQGEAYGMFLVHYPIALWLQYWLFDYDVHAIIKASSVFVLTVALSWAATVALRRIPGATHVL
jgi:acyltransferase-like protein